MTELDQSNIVSINAQQNLDEATPHVDSKPVVKIEEETQLDKLMHIRALAVQAAKATTSDAERQALQIQVNQLIEEMNQASGNNGCNTEKD